MEYPRPHAQQDVKNWLPLSRIMIDIMASSELKRLLSLRRGERIGIRLGGMWKGLCMVLGVVLCKRKRRRVGDENMNVGMAFCRNPC